MQNKNPQPLHKKWTWRKPKGKPKRPLSAYNIFFADVRQDLLTARKNNNGIGFQNLAQAVAKKWKDLDPLLKVPYIEKAKVAMAKYKVELSLWEDTQKDLKKGDFIPEVKVAAFNQSMATPITPINARNRRNETSAGSINESTSFFRASQHSPLPTTSSIETNTTPRHINYTYCTHIRKNDGVYAQSLIDDVSTSTRYLAVPSEQSPLYHSIGTAKACVTPTLHHRRLCSSNGLHSNIANDDSYEPLPLSNAIGQCYDRYTLPAAELDALNYRNCELFPLADSYRPAVDDANSGGSIYRTIDTCYNDPHEPTLNQCNSDDPNNSNWSAVQLEKLLRSLENEEWNRFL